MVEVALNSIGEKKNNNNEVEGTKGKHSNLEKRLSESLDNLKFDGSGTKDNHARPTSLMISRGSCGSDIALNTKNRRFIPSFNLSLTEGGIKPFSRAHRNNNGGNGQVSFGPGTQSFCYSPSPTNSDTKQYRRSVQVSFI